MRPSGILDGDAEGPGVGACAWFALTLSVAPTSKSKIVPGGILRFVGAVQRPVRHRHRLGPADTRHGDRILRKADVDDRVLGARSGEQRRMSGAPGLVTPPVVVSDPVTGSTSAVPAPLTTRVPKSRSPCLITLSGLSRATCDVVLCVRAAEASAGITSEASAATNCRREGPDDMAAADIGLT